MVYFICEGREFAPKAFQVFQIQHGHQPAKGEAPDDLHHYQCHSYRAKYVGAVIICCLLQLKPQQITQQNLMFLQLKGNQQLGMEK